MATACAQNQQRNKGKERASALDRDKPQQKGKQKPPKGHATDRARGVRGEGWKRRAGDVAECKFQFQLQLLIFICLRHFKNSDLPSVESVEPVARQTRITL